MVAVETRDAADVSPGPDVLERDAAEDAAIRDDDLPAIADAVVRPDDVPGTADPGPSTPDVPVDADAAATDVAPAETHEEPAVGDLVGEEASHYRLAIHHVRYKVDRGLFGDRWYDHPRFPFFVGLDCNEGSRNCMYLSEPWLPAPANVTQIVWLAAGQQGLRQAPGAFANIATGQEADWRPRKDATVVDAETLIRKRSIAGEIIADGMDHAGERYGFVPGNTLFLLALDAGFNYLLSAEDKDRVVAGYLDWIAGRVGDPGQVQRILLGGSSRGGCLALRLARRLLADPDYAGAQVLVGTLDGVCHPEQGEGGTVTADPIVNPVNPEFFAYRTDLASYLPASASSRAAIFQVVGGGPVIDLGIVGIAHGFVDTHVGV